MRRYKKNQNQELDRAIALLEIQRKNDLDGIKYQLKETYESLKPVNLLNQALVDFRNKPEVKKNIMESVISFAGGYVSKKLLLGKSNSFFKTILGYIVQYGVTKFISKKVDTN